MQAAFDGQRVMVANIADTVSLWNAADLSPLGAVPTGNLTTPIAVSRDGLDFWVSLLSTSELVRF